LKDLAKSSALIGSTEIALILVSIVRAKYLALSIGPEGYGEYSLLNSFFSILTALCSGWIARGTIKYIAEFKQKGDLESIEKVHNISISIVLILGTLITILVIIFNEFVRVNFLSKEIVIWHYYLFVASFLVNSFTPFYGWLLQGFLMVKKTVYLRVYSTLFSFVSILLFVYLFQLTGYFVSILFSGIFSLILYWKSSKKIVSTKFKFPNIKEQITIKLLKFGSVNFFLLIITNISEYLQRILILSNLNIANVGLLQVSNSILTYMGIANRSSLFYNDPKMAREITNEERNKDLNNYLRFNLLIGFPVAMFIILYSKELISILYSKDFTSLSSILFFFVVAQLIQFKLGGLHSILLGKTFLKIHSFVSVLSAILIVLIPYFFISKYGLIIIGVAMLISNLISFLIDYFYLNKKIGICILSNVISLIIIGYFFIAISYWIQHNNILIRTSYFLLFIFSIGFTISKNEWEKLKIIIRNKIRKTKIND
jgi:O-antigen/teichoic acid export membrane protein